MKKRVNGIEWVQSNDTICPHYIEKFKNKDIEECIKKEVSSNRLDIVYIPLDFCCVPMWPAEESQVKGAYESIFAVCIECDKICRGGAQLCMQFFIPHNVMKRGNNKWSWLPRVRCSFCSRKYMGDLVLMPYVIYTHRLISRELDTQIRQVNIRLKRNNYCRMCDKEIPKPNELCNSSDCKYGYTLLKKIDEGYAENTDSSPGLFQLLDLFQLLAKQGADINRALCQTDMCNRYTRGCRRAGNKNVMCNTCHRVSYCSKKCRTKDRKCGDHVCKKFWSDVFKIENIIIVND